MARVPLPPGAAPDSGSGRSAPERTASLPPRGALGVPVRPAEPNLLWLPWFLLRAACYCGSPNHSKLTESISEYFSELVRTQKPHSRFLVGGTPCSSPVLLPASPGKGRSLIGLQHGYSRAFPWHSQPRHVWCSRLAFCQVLSVWIFLTFPHERMKAMHSGRSQTALAARWVGARVAVCPGRWHWR